MIDSMYPELQRLQVEAVVACRPLTCRDEELREASTARYLSTQCGPGASRPMFRLTQRAFDALADVIAECERLTAIREELDRAG